MRLKYIVEKKDKNNELVLREYVENDRDRFSLLNEAVFDKKTISSAKKRGMKALIGALRTQNMYPPLKFAEKIADAVSEVLKSKKNPSTEIILAVGGVVRLSYRGLVAIVYPKLARYKYWR